MKLSHLKVACYLYNQFSDYDSSYRTLLSEYPILNLNNQEHLKGLIAWLRNWGCRQFKKSDEQTTINSIMKWYESNQNIFPQNNITLLDSDITLIQESVVKIFNELSNSLIATRILNDQKIKVNVGPVGSAKILFALMPNIFSPWDSPIIKYFKFKGNGIDYYQYLLLVKNDLLKIKKEFENMNFTLPQLFEYLDKKHLSYPKLIDEYYWIKITKKCNPEHIEKIIANQI